MRRPIAGGLIDAGAAISDIGTAGPRILAPALLALGLAMGGLYLLLSRRSGPRRSDRADPPVRPPA